MYGESEKERSYAPRRTEDRSFKRWNYERESQRVGSDDACSGDAVERG